MNLTKLDKKGIAELKIPLSRWGHNMIALNNQILLVFGGFGKGAGRRYEKNLDDTWLFNIETNTWHCLEISGNPGGRTDATLNIVNENLVLYGGYTGCFSKRVSPLKSRKQPYTWAQLLPHERAGHDDSFEPL